MQLYSHFDFVLLITSYPEFFSSELLMSFQKWFYIYFRYMPKWTILFKKSTLQWFTSEFQSTRKLSRRLLHQQKTKDITNISSHVFKFRSVIQDIFQYLSMFIFIYFQSIRIVKKLVETSTLKKKGCVLSKLVIIIDTRTKTARDSGWIYKVYT